MHEFALRQIIVDAPDSVLDVHDDVRILTALPGSLVERQLGLRAGGATVVCVNTNAVRQWTK